MSKPVSKSTSALPSFPVARPHQHEDPVDDIMGPLAKLKLAGYGVQESPSPWAGGFRPPASSSSGGRHKPLPPPPGAESGPAMPMPSPMTYSTSNTQPFGTSPMPIYIPPAPPILATEALILSQPDAVGFNRPESAPAPHTDVAFPVTPPRRKKSNGSPTSPGGLAVPSTPRPHALSNPTSPSSPAANDNDVTRCAGITKGDKRCQNKVKAGIPLTYIDGVPEEDIERYCHLHLKVILEPTGVYSRKQPSVWLEFSGNDSPLIPSNLSQGTQAALRTEISKAASSKDGPGYVYTFEIRQSDDSQYIHLKVGKASKVTRRLDQWNQQCPEEVVPRGVWPAPDNDGAAMLRGNIKPGRPSPFMGRLERLIHLELADLAVYAPYLPEEERPPVPGDGRAGPRRSSSDDAVAAGKSKKSTPSKPSNKPPQRQRVVCACGTVHQEIFIFKRARKGKYKDGIWENLVRPVITRWGTFVDEHVAV